MDNSIQQSNRDTFISYLKYISVGSVSVSVNYVVITICVELIEWYATFSSALAYFLSTTINYFLQYYWTFRAKRAHSIVVPRYALVTACTLSLNIAIFWGLTNFFNVWYLLSQTIIIMFISMINFFINRRYTFL